MTSECIPPAAVQPVASKDESREFLALFPDLVRDLTDAGRHLDIPEVTKWYSKVVYMNLDIDYYFSHFFAVELYLLPAVLVFLIL